MGKLFFILSFGFLFISCSKPEPRKPIIRKTSSFMHESIERNKVLNKLEDDMILLKIKRDSLHNYVNSEHGFWFYYKEKDTLNNKYPVKGDEVSFTYEIKDLKDAVIYTKEDLGIKNYLIDKEELITGLQEGIKLMKKGEIVIFIFPSYKAFGYTGSDRIKPNMPLIYTVELNEIKTKN